MSHTSGRLRPLRRSTVLAVTGLLLASAGPATAHGPDPLFGTRSWGANQVVGYTWQSGMVPPSWMQPGIDAGAGDVGESRHSRAATFVRQAGAASTVAYGAYMPCPSYAIACADRTGVPSSFGGLWFRVQGWAFDWGTMRWCQAQPTFSDGCYDVENIALDELGHIEILGHHVNYDDGSDFTDAVVQASARSRPRAGWNQHAFGDCDIARLQLEYERPTPSDPVSTCLSIASVTGLAASPTAAYSGTTVAFQATLRIVMDAPNYRALSGDPLSDRTVLLQRRAIGGTTWTTVSTMTPSASTEGLYNALWTPTASYDWRVLFASPPDEGVSGATSAVVRVTVSGCSGPGCPSHPTPGGGA